MRLTILPEQTFPFVVANGGGHGAAPRVESPAAHASASNPLQRPVPNPGPASRSPLPPAPSTSQTQHQQRRASSPMDTSRENSPTRQTCREARGRSRSPEMLAIPIQDGMYPPHLRARSGKSTRKAGQPSPSVIKYMATDEYAKRFGQLGDDEDATGASRREVSAPSLSISLID